MSLVGDKAAVISLGTSCQTAVQLTRHAPLLRAMLQDQTLAPSALPLDWTISPVATTTSLLGRPLDQRVPRTRNDLEWNVRPYWRELNLYYWHHFKTDGEIAPPAIFDETARAFAKRWHRLDAILRSGRRILFVLSNTQSNLEEDVASKVGTVRVLIEHSELRLLATLLRQITTNPMLLVITNRSRFSGPLLRLAAGYEVRFVPDMHGPWQGNDATWTSALSSIGHKLQFQPKRQPSPVLNVDPAV